MRLEGLQNSLQYKAKHEGSKNCAPCCILKLLTGWLTFEAGSAGQQASSPPQQPPVRLQQGGLSRGFGSNVALPTLDESVDTAVQQVG